jgi:hypothetical protein
MSRCLKLHVSVSQFFGTNCTHSRVPGLKGEALFLKILSFFGVFADPRLVRIHMYTTSQVTAETGLPGDFLGTSWGIPG